jgi:GntR family transcriptional repressor for pyruvate dehydrogenase complex
MTLTPDTRRLYQQVASAISESIESGKYQRGRRLPSERDLAAGFGVSRPTIREAMIALEIRGLAEIRHGSGIYVTERPPGHAGAADLDLAADLDIGAFELTEARRLFEGEAAALAATTISDERLQELKLVVAEMAGENARKEQSWAADRRFHIGIARATRNTAIAQVIENLLDLQHKSPLCSYMLERARRVGVQPRVSEHRRILVALRKHDPKAARNAMRDHLARVIVDLLAATEPDALDDSPARSEKRRNDYIRRLAI